MMNYRGRPAPGLRSILAAAVCLASGPAVAQDGVVYPANAADVSYAALDELPDLRGIWHPAFGQVGGDEPQLIGEAKETWEMHMARLEADPHYEIPEEKASNCTPPGMPYMMVMPYSLEFLVAPGKVVIVQEALMQVRRIFTDGRPLPEDPDPTFFGYSVGEWQGDTLVATTVGLQAGQRLGIRGIQNSEDLVIHERIYLDDEDPDVLHLEFTYEDPNVLAAPWRQTYRFNRDREWDILEYVCQENDRHPIGEGGQSAPILPSSD